MASSDPGDRRRIAIIGNDAAALLNFRGHLIRDLIAQGHDVLALAPDIQSISSELAQLGASWVSIPMVKTGLSPFDDAKTLLSLFLALRRFRPQSSLSYAAKPVVYGSLAAWFNRVPRRIAMIEGLGSVFIDSSMISLRNRLVRSVLKALYWVAFSISHKVLFLNRDDVSDFTTMGLLPAEKAKVIGGIGVDVEHWNATPAVRNPPVLTMVARVLRDKGIFEFISAARKVKQSHPEARFVLLGAPDTNPTAIPIATIQSWVEEGVIEWPGHVPVKPWLAQTSIFVLPSYREGVPRSTQEAMAMALPIITTDVPGCRETVVHGSNGYLVPPRDAESLAHAMLQIINEPSEMMRMGAESRSMAVERFNVRTINLEIVTLLREPV